MYVRWEVVQTSSESKLMRVKVILNRNNFEVGCYFCQVTVCATTVWVGKGSEGMLPQEIITAYYTTSIIVLVLRGGQVDTLK